MAMATVPTTALILENPPDDGDDTRTTDEPPKKKKAKKNDYRPTVCRLINYLDDKDYEKDDVTNGTITRDRLLQLTPADIMKWMNHEVFGVEDPGEDFGNMRPERRANCIEWWK